MTQTALGAALGKVGVPPADIAFIIALRKIAERALRASGTEPAGAVQGFLTLAGERSFRSGPLLAYLTAVASTLPPKAGRSGHNSTENQASDAAASGDASGQKRSANHLVDARPSPVSSTADERGQHGIDAHKPSAPSSAARTTGGQVACDAQPVSAPAVREPSSEDRNASRSAKNKIAYSIFDRHLGYGDLVLGDATKENFINMRKKGIRVTSAIDRLLTDVDWPDMNRTPLRKCATASQVEAIIKASDRSLDMLGVTNVRP